MTQILSFAGAEAALTRAARSGCAEAAELLAQSLRLRGESASVESAPDGTARVVLEGAHALAREFGTQASPAQPIAGPALQENRARVGETIARNIRHALRGRR
jgi:hypothetical protein